MSCASLFSRFLVACALLVVLPAAASATTFTVTSSNDAGAGTLRAAVTDALAAPLGVHDIAFADGLGPITLVDPLPVIDTSLTIGNVGGEQVVRRDGAAIGVWPIFEIDSAEVSLRGMSIEDGILQTSNSPVPLRGAGVRAGLNSIVRLSDCRFDNNRLIGDGSSLNPDPNVSQTVAQGAAVYTEATLFITNCEFDGNRAIARSPRLAQAEGGAVYAVGALVVDGAQFTDNTVEAARRNGETGGREDLVAGGAAIATGTTAFVDVQDIFVEDSTATAYTPFATKDARVEINGSALLLRGSSPDVQRVDVVTPLTYAFNEGWTLGGDDAATNNTVTVNGSAMYVNGGGEVRDITIQEPRAELRSISLDDTTAATHKPTLISGGAFHIATRDADTDQLTTNVANVAVYDAQVSLNIEDTVGDDGYLQAGAGFSADAGGVLNLEHVAAYGLSVNAVDEEVLNTDWAPSMNFVRRNTGVLQPLQVNIRNSIVSAGYFDNAGTPDEIAVDPNPADAATVTSLGGNLLHTPGALTPIGSDVVSAVVGGIFSTAALRPFADMPVLNRRIPNTSPAVGIAVGSTVLTDAVGAPRAVNGGTAGPVERYAVATAPLDSAVQEAAGYTGSMTYDQPLPITGTLSFTVLPASTALVPQDALATSPFAITAAAGSTDLRTPVGIVDDFIPEASKALALRVTSADKRVRVDPARRDFTVTINDLDAFKVASITSRAVGEATSDASIQVNVTPAVPADTTFNLAYSGTAARNSDFTGPNSVVVPSGATSVSVPITITADADDEALESIIVTMSSPNGWVQIDTGAGTVNVTDDDAPSVVVAARPDAVTSTSSATFTFTGSPGVTSYECALDDAAFATCASTLQLVGLTDGLHVLQVRAVDSEGQRSAISATTWRVERRAPAVTVTARPATTSRFAKNSIRFTLTDATHAECSLNGRAFVRCSSPYTVNVPSQRTGAHIVQLRAVGADRSTSTAVTVAWRVDRIAPTLTKLRPASASSVRFRSRPLIGAVARDLGTPVRAVAAIALYVDGKKISPRLVKHTTRSGAIAYRAPAGLRRGGHTVKLIVTDLAGNRTTSTWRFRVR